LHIRLGPRDEERKMVNGIDKMGVGIIFLRG
jgi:hypothetical protein